MAPEERLEEAQRLAPLIAEYNALVEEVANTLLSVRFLEGDPIAVEAFQLRSMRKVAIVKKMRTLHTARNRIYDEFALFLEEWNDKYRNGKVP